MSVTLKAFKDGSVAIVPPTGQAIAAVLSRCKPAVSKLNADGSALLEARSGNTYIVRFKRNNCYGNRKIQCLDRLFKKTGHPLFEQLKNRVMQLNFYVQVADGPYKGAMTEAIADPWLERGRGFEWRGSPYTSELVMDLMLQLIDMGWVAKP